MVYSHCKSAKSLWNAVRTQVSSSAASPQESAAIAQALLEHICGLSSVDTVVDKFCVLRTEQLAFLKKALERLSRHEPLQYILEKAYFLGRPFKVNPTVLIPRPETEEMVAAILSEILPEQSSVLDVGTGSGCIAITLQCERSDACVLGVDSCTKALQLASQNGRSLGAKVVWQRCDVLAEALPDQKWHVVVSNPPYVLSAEKENMSPRVLNHEPSTAIFVPDEDPLLFHRIIALQAMDRLHSEGKLYMEINETLGKETALLVVGAGFSEVEVKKDLHGKDRWIRAVRPTVC